MSEEILIEIYINDQSLGQVMADSLDSPAVQSLLNNWLAEQQNQNASLENLHLFIKKV